MLSVVTNEQTAPELRMDLDELAREGARRMLAKPSQSAAGIARHLDATRAKA
jgi:hypothetical protein